MAASDTARSYTISLPPETAEQAEELAAGENRSMSELVGEALNTYCAQQTEE